jgi:cytochrome P450
MTVVRLIAAAVLVLVVIVPWLRLPADREFRSMFPMLATAALLGAAFWTIAVVVVVLALPVAILPLALVAASVATGFWWWARPAPTRRSGRPPGSRSFIRSIRMLAHRTAYLDLARRYGPVFMTSQFGRPVVCVVGLERGQRLLRANADSFGPSPLRFAEEVTGGFLRYMDDETHDRYGPVFRRAMSTEVNAAVAPRVGAVLQDELLGMNRNGESPVGAMGRISEAALLWSLLGMDPESAAGVDYQKTSAEFSRRTTLRPDRRSGSESFDRLRGLVRDQMAAIESGSVPPCALSEIRLMDPALPDDVCIDNLIFMHRLGVGNLAGLLVWLVQMLGTNEQWRQRLGRAEGAERRALADAFVDETLRLAQSEYLYRSLTADVEFEGFHLQAGQLVRLCVWESHRDPAVFDHPADLTDRFVMGTPPQGQYCPFGFGRHACNAGSLVIMVGVLLVEAIADDPTISIEPSTSLSRDARHWAHWRPGPDLHLSRISH